MELRLKDLILKLLDEHRVMTVATNRADGWPQATMVGYVNDGFMLYCFVARNCQKHANILRDPRVSITIGDDARHPLDIRALSLAGRASVVDDEDERDYVAALRLRRFPEYGSPPPPLVRGAALSRVAPRPPSSGVVLLRIAPEIFSVLDYSKSFGHSDLVTFSERDLDFHLETLRHEWDRRAETSADDDRSEPPAGR
jgi:nitroimidazol reductase NimA-like FMN-containing flavoprotein (pyridoxamine 5'-phosphate oxidase superfamily)